MALDFTTIWWFHFSLYWVVSSSLKSVKNGCVAFELVVWLWWCSFFSSFLFIVVVVFFAVVFFFFLSRKLWLMKYNMFMCLAKFHLFSLFGITSQELHMYKYIVFFVFVFSFLSFLLLLLFSLNLIYSLFSYLTICCGFISHVEEEKKTISNVISFALSWVNAQSVCRHTLHIHTRARRQMCRRNSCVNL